MTREDTVSAARRELKRMYRGQGYGTFYAFVREKLCPFFTVEQFVPPAGRIIDIGCGYGLFAHILTLMSPGREVIGIDKSPYRISKACATRHDNRKLSFICGDIRDIALEKCSAITMIDFLHHIPFSLQDEIMDRIPALLDAGGVVVIKEFDDRPLWKYWATLLFEAVFYPRDQLAFRPVSEWRMKLERMGFTVETHADHTGSFVSSVIIVAKKGTQSG